MSAYTAEDFDTLASDCEKGWGENAKTAPALRAAAKQARVIEKLKAEFVRRDYVSSFTLGTLNVDAADVLGRLLAEEGLS